MSVLIKGMEMPKPGTYDGRLTVTLSGDALFCLFHEYGAYPVKEIPPHGRLIDADALNAEIKGPSRPEIYDGMEEVWWIEKCLANAPTIIEAEEGE